MLTWFSKSYIHNCSVEEIENAIVQILTGTGGSTGKNGLLFALIKEKLTAEYKMEFSTADLKKYLKKFAHYNSDKKVWCLDNPNKITTN